MRRGTVRLALGLLAGMALPGGALATSGPAKDALLQDAIMHTQQAIAEGKAGRAEGVEEHAREALGPTERIAKDDPNAAQAAKQLEGALAAAEAGDAAAGAFHAVLAQGYLQASVD